jgi:hypothetical protein
MILFYFSVVKLCKISTSKLKIEHSVTNSIFLGKKLPKFWECFFSLEENFDHCWDIVFSFLTSFLTSFLPTFYKKMDAALYLYAFQYIVFLGIQYSGCLLPTDTIFRTTGRPLFLCKHMTTLCFQSVAVVDCQGHGPLIIGVPEKMILSSVV